jgi:hypothetical protein
MQSQFISLDPDRDQHARRYDRRAGYYESFASKLKFHAGLPAGLPIYGIGFTRPHLREI